jgi:inosine/xanthosine triphosphatase
MKIIVASANPVKLQAVSHGFERMFPGQEFQIEQLAGIQGNSSQPRGDQETLLDASTRAERAARLVPQADYWVGVEGGVEEHASQMAAFAWIVIKSKDRTGKGRTGAFYLPQSVANLVRQGKELGEADDIIFGRSNSKQANGAIGILTGDVVDRAQLYEQAVILALIPFKNPLLYEAD